MLLSMKESITSRAIFPGISRIVLFILIAWYGIILERSTQTADPSSTGSELKNQMFPTRLLSSLLSRRLTAKYLFVNSFPIGESRAFHCIGKILNKTSRVLSSTSEQAAKRGDHYITPDLDLYMPELNKNGKPYSLYEKCVRRLYLTNLFHPVRLGLQNIEELHQALGNPMDRSDISVIHVAGSNGKGSTSMKIARTLELAGHKVGLFVSPHIASFRERMQVNSEPITEKEVEEYLPFIYELCEKERIPATFFEVTTALAFHFFSQRNVDVVVLETGLGGRLDATNVVKKPDLCVITSISLEHTRILGDTIELIALEKAGIIKKGTPVLVGPNCPHTTIRKRAMDIEAANYYTCDDVSKGSPKITEKYDLTEKSTFMDYDLENSMIACSALKILYNMQNDTDSNVKFAISDENLREGLSQRPSCRFEEITIPSTVNAKGVKVILDVAHNPDAIAFLLKKLVVTYPGMQDKMRFVVGFSRDKDLTACGSTLLDFVSNPSSIHLVEAAHPRAATFEEILSAQPLLRKSNFDEVDTSITCQVQSAVKLAEAEDEILIICGSVFLMAEAREAIGINEPRDSKYIAEVAGANLKYGQEFFGDQDPEKN